MSMCAGRDGAWHCQHECTVCAGRDGAWHCQHECTVCAGRDGAWHCQHECTVCAGRDGAWHCQHECVCVQGVDAAQVAACVRRPAVARAVHEQLLLNVRQRVASRALLRAAATECEAMCCIACTAAC